MVSTESVEKQLKRIKFDPKSWGKAEIQELPNILIEDEEIHECVNGLYEGGFALLVATNIRMLLIDKKPLNFLTVEDLRFDMINEIDYSHRLLGATINVSAGSKNLQFRSYNQQRLRKLINHVQHGIAETKKIMTTHQQGQNQHLEQINQQLQAYLVATHEQQEKLRQQLADQTSKSTAAPIDAPTFTMPVLELPKPTPQLADYLLAQRLMEQIKDKPAEPAMPAQPVAQKVDSPATTPPAQHETRESQMKELYAEGMQEVFGKHVKAHDEPTPQTATGAIASTSTTHSLEVNALRIAYSKLPMALRNRKFGRPSFHAHSKSSMPAIPTPALE